jgi:hypothetical protein
MLDKALANNYIQAPLKFQSHYLLYFAFFALGFGQYIFYLPLFLLYYFLIRPNLKHIMLGIDFFVLTMLLICFLTLTFGIGYERLTIDTPWKTFVVIIFAIVIGGYAFQKQHFNIQLRLIGFYLFGLFCCSFFVVTYSYVSGPRLFGYGNLLNPFSGEEVNSPMFGDMLALSSGYFYYFILYKKSFLLKIISTIILTLSIVSAIFLGGRAFFIVFVLMVFFYFGRGVNKKTILNLLLGFLLLFFIFSYFYYSNDIFAYYVEIITNRFAEQGVESTRFELYINGLKMMVEYPFGGFKVPSSVEATKWFHNIFLDTARVAGWLPLFFLLTFFVYPLKFLLFKRKFKDYILFLWLCISSFLFMQQGVVIESRYSSLIVFFFASLALLNSKIDKKYLVNK